MGRFNPGGDTYLPSLLIQLPRTSSEDDLQCLDGLIQWIHRRAKCFPGFVTRGFDPLRWIMDSRNELEAGKHNFEICASCKGLMYNVFDGERMLIWDSIREYFDLVSLRVSSRLTSYGATDVHFP